MSIKPKYTIEESSSMPVISRQFTGRKEFISLFQKTLSEIETKENKIHFFYGVGGVGKSALKRKFCDILKTSYPDCIWNIINLEESIYGDSETALFQLRSNLKDIYKIEFPNFDIAYYYLITKTRPHLVSEISNKINLENLKSELAELPGLEPAEISARLPAYWANDVKPYLKNKNLVLLIDSYDEFLKDNYLLDTNLRHDEWIRELVLNLPEAKWIMFGREKLRWEEIDKDWNDSIDYHLVDNFNNSESKNFLESCGIKDIDIQSIIIKNSKGLPYYLDLAVDTFYEIKNTKKREPLSEDFAKTQPQVLVNFLKYLDNTEIYALKVLSIANFWDKDIFLYLMKKFDIAFPLIEKKKLFRFSFVKERMQVGNYDMNELMRDGLQNIIDAELLKSIHKAMYEYYIKKLKGINAKNISANEKQALTEAFYHGKYAIEPKEFSEWFINISKLFIVAAEHKLLITLFEELYIHIQKKFGDEHIEISNVLERLSHIYILQGKYTLAEKYLIIALKIMEKISGKEHNEVANILNSIALLYNKQGKHKEEELILQRALEIKLRLFDPEHPELIKTYWSLANLYNYIGKFEEAESYYKKAIKITEKKCSNNWSNLGELFANLGMVYGKSARYSEAESLLLKALEIFKKYAGSNHFYLIPSMISLANLYFDMGKYAEGEDLYLNSLKMNEKIFGFYHPETALILTNLGNLFLTQNRYSDAKTYYERALKITEKITGSEHPDIAMVSNNLAYLYYLLDKDELALPLYKRAYKIYRRKIGYNHPAISNIMENVALIYRRNNKFDIAEKLLDKALKINESLLGSESQVVGETYKYFGELYEEKGDLLKSTEYYEKTLPLFLKAFGNDHNDVIYISKKISELKAKIL